MTITSDAKRLLAKTIRELREKIILPDLREATERAYQLAIDAKKATLSEAARVRRARIEAWLDEQTRGIATKARPEAKQRIFGELIKDAGATLLQRLVYLRLLEANGLRTVPVVTGGWDSRGYKDFREVAPELVVADKSGGKIRDDSDGYSTLLALVFNELALDLPGLFGPVRVTALVPVPTATLRSIIKALNDAELASAWTDDTTLGWIYQYWNDPEREALDRKLAAQKKLENHEIASKTQMFTERYMVEWLLHNSLGQRWLAICQKHGWTADVRRDPGSGSVLDRLDARRAEWRGKRERGEVTPDALMPIEAGIDDRWKYWVPQPMPDDAVTAAPGSVRDMKLLDPACGSGHFLVIAFELLFHLYKEEARHRDEVDRPEWSNQAIVESILENNLHGIDVDPRAIQIAAAALMLKAKLTCRDAEPRMLNLVAPAFGLDTLADDDSALRALVAAVEHETGIPPALTKQIVGALAGANHLGSLLKVDAEIDVAIDGWDDKPSSTAADQGSLFTGFRPKGRKRITGEQAKATLLNQLERFLAHHARGADLGLRLRGEQLAAGVRFMRMVREGQYDLVVGNPPYLGVGKLADKSYLKAKYDRAKGNLYSAFIARALSLVAHHGLVAMATLEGWLFTPQFADFRAWMFSTFDLRCVADLRWAAFENMRHDTVCLFAVQNDQPSGMAVALCPTDRSERDESNEAMLNKRVALLAQERRSLFSLATIKRIPETPLVYWWTDREIDEYSAQPLIGATSRARKGIDTGDNVRFVRFWWEVPLSALAPARHNGGHREARHAPTTRWAPYVMGGQGRAWIEPLRYVVDWKNDGLEILVSVAGGSGTIRNPQYFFRNAVAFTPIGASFAARKHRYRSICDNMGTSVFTENPDGIVCLLNSERAARIAADLNSSIHFQAGDVNRLPLLLDHHAHSIVQTLEASFDRHEAAREPSFEFKRPGNSNWDQVQSWALASVNRSNTNEPPSSFVEDRSSREPSVQLSFALGIALGRFGANGEGVLTEAPASALPNGILYLSDATDLVSRIKERSTKSDGRDLSVGWHVPGDRSPRPSR